MVRLKRNPLTDAIRKLLDQATYALMVHGIYVSEYLNDGNVRGVEYVLGTGKESHVMASWDANPHDPETIQWHHNAGVTMAQKALVRAHANLLATI